MKPERLALIILALALAAAAVAFGPLAFPHSRIGRAGQPKLGLDIRGGTRVVLKADTARLPAGVAWNQDTKNAVIRILENRVNANGVAEASVAVKGSDQFVVELPEITNDAQVLEQLQNTAQLQFFYYGDWKTNRNTLGRYDFQRAGDTGAARESTSILDRNAPGGGKVFRDPFHLNLALRDLIAAGASAGTGKTVSVPLPADLKELPAAASLPGGTVTLAAADAKQLDALTEELAAFKDFLKQAELKMTGSDLLSNAQGGFSPQGRAGAVVTVNFNGEGGRKFADFTRDHVGEILMAYLDGQILSTPNIEEPILNGSASISGFATVADAQRLANYLNGGALPVPLKIVQQQHVEATLGADAVRQGLTAGVVGIAAVLAFMMLYYLLPGAIACVALILYGLLTYAIFLLIPVTFTLPGIAGFILSVGMAVDANVLIFERTKEELRAGKALRPAVEAGFQRAFSAIFDSNFCTAVTSLFLYNFGTGPVRGFALTLLIGVAVSMFTAITVSRTLLLLLVRTRAGRNLNAWGVNRTWHPRMNVVGKRKFWYGVSLAVIVPGLIFAALGGFKPGIDFTGGSELTLRFAKPVTRSQVEQAIRAQNVAEPIAQVAENGYVFVRLPQKNGQQMTSPQAAALVQSLNGRFNGGVTQEGFESIGSSISSELTRNALTAILFSSLFIMLYLASRFAVGGFVNGIKFGAAAVIAMLHDIAVLVGVFVILGYFANWKIDSLFVTAALTVIGFSVHDTIVIFDRIRENLRLRAKGEVFEDTVNKSINETFARSINTSLTVVLTLVALLVLGGPVIRPLNAALLIGIISGTYSSIFNAAPLVVDWERWFGGRSRGAVVAATGGGEPRPAAPARPAPSLAGNGAAATPGARPIPPLRPSAPGSTTNGDGGARAYPLASNGSGDGPARPIPPPPGPARRKRRM